MGRGECLGGADWRSLAAASADPIAELLAEQLPAPYGLVDEVEDDPSGEVIIEHVPPVNSSSGGGDANQIYLGKANKRADIFVAPANTVGVEHGHTGLYYDPERIIEAPGVGQLSHRTSALDKFVTAGVQIQKIVKSDGDRIGTERRAHVADWAYANLRRKDYRIQFYDNKYTHSPDMNCSQLVWAAFLVPEGIDLDYNGGAGVYPYDIRDSPKTDTYKIRTQ